MELNEKLQELRKKRGLTQEELAARLYVSRTAVSKWESGRGYPSIESLKAIASFFGISVDELISPNEALTIAQENQKQRDGKLKDLVFGLVDLCMALLLFLPFFATKSEGYIREVSLLSLEGVQGYIRIIYFSVVSLMTISGVLSLSLKKIQVRIWNKCKTKISLVLGVVATLVFMVSMQPYAAVFAFSLLIIKAILLIKAH